jgi:hypothetical protein
MRSDKKQVAAQMVERVKTPAVKARALAVAFLKANPNYISLESPDEWKALAADSHRALKITLDNEGVNENTFWKGVSDLAQKQLADSEQDPYVLPEFPESRPWPATPAGPQSINEQDPYFRELPEIPQPTWPSLGKIVGAGVSEDPTGADKTLSFFQSFIDLPEVSGQDPYVLPEFPESRLGLEGVLPSGITGIPESLLPPKVATTDKTGSPDDDPVIPSGLPGWESWYGRTGWPSPLLPEETQPESLSDPSELFTSNFLDSLRDNSEIDWDKAKELYPEAPYGAYLPARQMWDIAAYQHMGAKARTPARRRQLASRYEPTLGAYVLERLMPEKPGSDTKRWYQYLDEGHTTSPKEFYDKDKMNQGWDLFVKMSKNVGRFLLLELQDKEKYDPATEKYAMKLATDQLVQRAATKHRMGITGYGQLSRRRERRFDRLYRAFEVNRAARIPTERVGFAAWVTENYPSFVAK